MNKKSELFDIKYIKRTHTTECLLGSVFEYHLLNINFVYTQLIHGIIDTRTVLIIAISRYTHFSPSNHESNWVEKCAYNYFTYKFTFTFAANHAMWPAKIASSFRNSAFKLRKKCDSMILSTRKWKWKRESKWMNVRSQLVWKKYPRAGRNCTCVFKIA